MNVYVSYVNSDIIAICASPERAKKECEEYVLRNFRPMSPPDWQEREDGFRSPIVLGRRPAMTVRNFEVIQ